MSFAGGHVRERFAELPRSFHAFAHHLTTSNSRRYSQGRARVPWRVLNTRGLDKWPNCTASGCQRLKGE